MPAHKGHKNKSYKKKIGKKKIIQAIQAAARKLGRTPIQAEFVRMSGIEVAVIKRHFRWFPTAVRAAGLTPQAGQRVETADMLKDWGEVVRRMGRVPGYNDYIREGRYGPTVFQKRFRRWSMVSAGFMSFIEAGGLTGEWGDVVAMIRKRPMPAQGQGRWLHYTNPLKRPTPMREGLPEAVRTKRCVTATMLAVFFSESFFGESFLRKSGETETWSGRAVFQRRVLPDRPLLGPPMQRTGMAYEPVNEMGVIMLFSMYAERLGFIIEFAQAKYPDCKAKMEVEPGRWQDVDIEFETYSANFKEHGHDAKKCDLIICWKHNWPDCPEHIMVLELSKLVGSF